MISVKTALRAIGYKIEGSQLANLKLPMNLLHPHHLFFTTSLFTRKESFCSCGVVLLLFEADRGLLDNLIKLLFHYQKHRDLSNEDPNRFVGFSYSCSGNCKCTRGML